MCRPPYWRYQHHISLKISSCITQPKGHPLECDCPIRPSKGSFILIILCNRHLTVTRITIKKTVPPFFCKPIQQFIHKGHRKMVFLNPCIQFPVIHTNFLSYYRPYWNKIILHISDHSHSAIFGHTFNRAYPTAIYDRIYDSDIQLLNNLLLNHLLHRWIQMSLVLNTWLVIGHEMEFVLTNSGWDPNNVHNSPTNGSFELFNTSTRHSTCSIFKSGAIITDKVSYHSKNTYLR